MLTLYTLHSDGTISAETRDGSVGARPLAAYLPPCVRAVALFDDRTLLDTNEQTLADLVELLDACAGVWHGYRPVALFVLHG